MPRGRIAHRLTQRLVRVEPADQAGELQVVLRVAEDETGFPVPDQFTGARLGAGNDREAAGHGFHGG